MNVSHAPKKRRNTFWDFDVTHAVYDNACAAMETRPDYPEIERLWVALDERFKFMKYDFNPDVDDDAMYQMDLSELADEASIADEACKSHLETMQGAGLIRAAVFYQDFNSVSVVIAPHMVAK